MTESSTSLCASMDHTNQNAWNKSVLCNSALRYLITPFTLDRGLVTGFTIYTCILNDTPYILLSV